MKPIKVNYEKINGKRTSTTINGEIADYYFRVLVEYHQQEIRNFCDDLEKYRFAMETKCQQFINERAWHDKGQIERYLINEIIKMRSIF